MKGMFRHWFLLYLIDCNSEGWRVVATTLEKGNDKLKEVADLTLNADVLVIYL